MRILPLYFFNSFKIIKIVLSKLLLVPVVFFLGCTTRTDAADARTPPTLTCPVEAYYAGFIEHAIQLLENLSGEFTPVEQKLQLVTLYWEMGENARAANLLEELLHTPYLMAYLTATEIDELHLELFITHVLSGNYALAAQMRSNVETSIQRMDDRMRARFYFYNAFVHHEMGELIEALAFYRRSLALYRWRALAWYRLGSIIIETDPAEALTAFQTSRSMDMAFTPVLLPLARLLADRGEWEQARTILTTANTRRPDDAEISALLAEVMLHVVPPADVADPVRRRITAVPPRVTPSPFTREEGIMRIGLNVNRSLVSVKAGGEFTIANAQSGEVLYSGIGREQIWVRQDSDGALVIFDENDRILLSSPAALVYRLNSNYDTSIVVGIVGGAPGTNRTYRGDLEFIPEASGFTVVNIVAMEDYLLGVVPAELPATWPMEALQAQAIIARSYAIAYRGRFAARGFDIWGDPRSQAYGGVGIEHPRSTAAVNATTGIILVGESGQPLAAFYSANHGGHSEYSRVMWGADAYMQAVQDIMLPPRPSPLPPDALFRWLRDFPETYSNIPGFFFANTYRWERWITPEEIRRRLILDGRVRQDPGEIHRIVSRGRGISGRIVELEIQGSKGNVHVRSDAVWFTMGGLRSSLFTIRSKQEPDDSIRYFVFQGAGYGHGIGMDQHAAAGKASRGFTAEEILLHFFPRASLQQLTRY